MNNKSGFHRHSIGIVAKDKEEDGYVIEVFPIESQTHTDGDIDKTYVDKVFNKDIHGNTKNIVLNKRVTLKATWMPFGDSNRSTAPNVKKGEQIQVYRYANTDDFYWDTIYNEFDLRRKEKIIHLYGNTDNFKEILTTSNTYWKKMDTINKIVQLHTCDNDGELTTYDIMLDTKQGVLTVSDGRGNFIKLESAKDKLTTNILEDVEINTKRVLINASESFKLNTKTVDINSTENLLLSSGSFNINASNTNLTTNINISGNSVIHNGRNIGDTHVHPESIGSKTSGPE